jgi:hypothetical protein
MATITRRGAFAAISALLTAAVLALAFGGESADPAPASQSTPPRGPLVPTPGHQTSPAVASNGAGFLVTWEDRGSGGSSESDIYASRVDADGTTRDPDGIPIHTAPGLQWTPDVASDGTNYLVVWTDSQSGTRNDVRAARVAPDGEVLDPGGFLLTAQEQNGGYGPHVDFDGVNYLVVYGNYDRIRGVRVSTNGQILDPGGFAISNPAQPAVRSGLSYGAGEYLVTWNSSSQVFGARVTPEGAVLDPNGVPISPSLPESYSNPVSTFDGTNFVVAWEDWRLDHVFHVFRIYAARVTPGGTVLDPQNIPITPPPQPQSRDPGIASSGESSLIVFGLDDVRGARLAPDGTVLDPNGLVISSQLNAQQEPEIAFGAGEYLAAWQDGRAAGRYDIIGSRIAPDGTVLDPVGLLISGSGPPPDPVPAPPQPPPPPPPPPPIIEPPPPAPRCIVPRVVGLRLSLAQRKIRRARCTVGRVRRKRSARAGIVLSQKPRARAIRRRGFPVTLVVGRR